LRLFFCGLSIAQHAHDDQKVPTAAKCETSLESKWSPWLRDTNTINVFDNGNKPVGASVDNDGHVSKVGDSEVRTALYEAASAREWMRGPAIPTQTCVPARQRRPIATAR